MPNVSATKEWNYRATTTMEAMSPFIADNVTARIWLLHVLDELKGLKAEVRGGLDIRFRIFKELASAEDYTDLDTATPTRADPLTTAVYTWRQVRAPILLSGRDMAINMGSPHAVSSVLTAHLQAAEQALRDRIGGSSGIFSTNGDSASGIQGLQDMVTHASNAQPTTGTSGGVNRATITTWRNQVVDIANDFSANGYTALAQGWLLGSRGDEVPDIIVFTRSSYQHYITNSTATLNFNLPRTSQTGSLNLGFSNVNYNGAVTGFDDGVAADMAYMLSSKYNHWIVHPARNFQLGPAIAPSNQDALAWWVYVMANYCLSNMARQVLLRRGDTN